VGVVSPGVAEQMHGCNDLPGFGGMTTEETLPWIFTGAHESIDGKYAIGVIVSEKICGAICAISYDGVDMETNLARLNAAGKIIVERVNGGQ
jgi:hypothetical protein